MNQFFSIERFLMLFKKHTVENYKTYLMSAGVLGGILLAFLGFASYTSNGYLSGGAQLGFFISFLLLAGCIFTSMIFSDLGDKKKAIPMLTLPTSHFEKYLVGWLYSFVIFQLLYLLLFYLSAIIVIHLGHPTTLERSNTVVNIFTTDIKPEPYYAFIVYTFLHAVVFLGAIYFEKLHFIKTAFALFTGIFLLGILNKPIISTMIKTKIIGTTIFSPVSVTESDRAWTIHALSVQNYQSAIVIGLIVLILWISAYYKLKEKEV